MSAAWPKMPKLISSFLALASSVGFGALVASNSACTFALGKTTDQCTVNSDCVGKFGDGQVCRKSDNTCQALVTTQCPYVYGTTTPDNVDNAIYIGVIISLTGPYGSGYRPYEAAARTAIEDFRKDNDLPPSAGSAGKTRPLLMVECDDASASEDDNATVLKSAHHLVDDLQVPAIIGTPSTSTTIAVANVAIPQNVFVISPSATGANLTSLSDNGLVWRTGPSDTYQGPALASYLSSVLIPRIRAKNSLAAGGVKILSFFRGDVYGQGLEAIFKGTDAFKNSIQKETFKEFGYSTDDGSPSNTDVQQQIAGFAPHIILAFGFGEVATNVIKPTEDLWATAAGSAPRPYYLATDGVVSDNTTGLGSIIAGSPDLYKRVVYTTAAVETSDVYNRYHDSFVNLVNGPAYEPQFRADIINSAGSFGAPGAYDSVYIAGYGITAATARGGKAVATGADIAQAMTKLTTGSTPADLWWQVAAATLPALSNGNSVKINGASGPLDFDLTTGDVVTDIAYQCAVASGDQQASGLVYQSGPKTLSGTFNACGYTP